MRKDRKRKRIKDVIIERVWGRGYAERAYEVGGMPPMVLQMWMLMWMRIRIPMVVVFDERSGDQRREWKRGSI